MSARQTIEVERQNPLFNLHTDDEIKCLILNYGLNICSLGQGKKMSAHEYAHEVTKLADRIIWLARQMGMQYADSRP